MKVTRSTTRSLTPIPPPISNLQYTRDTRRHCDLQHIFFEAVEDAYLPYLPAAIQVPKLVSGVDHCATFATSAGSDTQLAAPRKSRGSPFHARLGDCCFLLMYMGENLLVSVWRSFRHLFSADLGKFWGAGNRLEKTFFFFVAREARPIAAKSLFRFAPFPPFTPPFGYSSSR